MKRYKSKLSKKTQTNFVIDTKRVGPTILSKVLDQKLRAMIVDLRTTGAVVNIHVVCGVLGRIIRSNLEKFGQFSDFEVIRSWVCSLYHCMNFSWRAAPTSRPIVTWPLWEAINTQHLHDIAWAIWTHNILDELILNADQHHQSMYAQLMWQWLNKEQHIYQSEGEMINML